MMQADLFLKGPRFPPLSLCAQKRDQINPPGSYGRVTSDIFKTFAPAHLAGSRDMFGALKATARPAFLLIRSARHSQPGILGKLVHETPKVVYIRTHNAT